MTNTDLTEQVSVVLSKETHDLLKAITKEIGSSKSEFIRIVLKEQLKKMKEEVLIDE